MSMITSKEFKSLTSMLTSPTTMMCYLLLEIIIDILSWLPMKSLVRFQCVSKGWHALINGQDFIKLHLHCSFKSNTDRTLIVQEQNADFPFDFFSVSFRDKDRFRDTAPSVTRFSLWFVQIRSLTSWAVALSHCILI